MFVRCATRATSKARAEFKVIKIDKKRSNVVVSRRAVVEKEMSAERQEFLNTLVEGQTVKGVVKNLTDYGAFIDLGGIDGLLHITDRPGSASSIRPRCSRSATRSRPGCCASSATATACRSASSSWVTIRGSISSAAIRSVPVCSARSPTSPTTAHSLRSNRASRVWCTFRDGLDQQEYPPVQGRAARRRGRGDDPRYRSGTSPHLARHEAVQAEPVGRIFRQPPEEREDHRQDQVDHRLRHLRWPGKVASTGLFTCPTCPGAAPVRKPCATSRRATRWRPSFWPSIRSANAFRWDSNSSMATRLLPLSASMARVRSSKGIVTAVEAKGATVKLGDDIEGYLRASGAVARSHRGCALAAQGRRRGGGQDHRHRPQDPQDLAVGQGQGHAGRNRGSSGVHAHGPSGGTALGDILKDKLGSQGEEG